jgi:hypothetical protein
VFSKRVGHPYQNRNPPQRKKPRTSFNKIQVVELEKRFMKQKYLASSERLCLANNLKMTDGQGKEGSTFLFVKINYYENLLLLQLKRGSKIDEQNGGLSEPGCFQGQQTLYQIFILNGRRQTIEQKESERLILNLQEHSNLN